MLPAIALLLPRLSTIDLAYQVRAGRLMLDQHALLRVDAFTFSVGGQPWLNQQWGAEVLFGLGHRLGGWPLLILLRAVLGGVIFGLVYRACRERGAAVRLAAGLTLGSFALALPGLVLRPQLLGLALFALTLLLVATRTGRPTVLWAIPVVTVVWANVHGSFFLAPVLLGLAALEDRLARSPAWRRDLWVAAASIAAATVTPFGLRVWGYALGLGTNPEVTRTIEEWRPTSIRSPFGALFFVSVALVAVILARRGRPAPVATLVGLAVFFAIGLFAVRGIYWWAMYVPVALAPLLTPATQAVERHAGVAPQNVAQTVGRPDGNDDTDGSIDRPNRVNDLIALMLVLLGVAFLPWWRASDGGTNLLDHAPLALTDRLEEIVGPDDRVFDPQLWGSWFELDVADTPVFVDPRIEIFPAEVWRDYDAVSGGQDGWQAILDRWGVSVVVAERGQQAGLLPRIEADPGWRLAYEDGAGAIFVRS
jgi:hypothetical protein